MKCLIDETATPSPVRDLLVLPMGRLSYDAAEARQRRSVDTKLRNRSRADRLMLMELDPVITMGTGGGRDQLLVDFEWLRDRSIEFRDSRRGGGATYHGPGQLVAYPIVDLRASRNLRVYLRQLEEVVIETLADCNLRAHTASGLTGVWLGENKIAAIGIRVQRWITSYGVSVNVAPDLSNFRAIDQCGLSERGVTSMERELGVAPTVAAVADRFADHFRRTFGYGGGR